jgi:ankyrin repeat protein/predicted negative regulator of RcsB-dependent stress response
MRKTCFAIMLGIALLSDMTSPVFAGELHDAIYGGNLVKTREALEKGADVNTAGPGGQVPLMIALTLGKAEMVRLLLEKGANVNARIGIMQAPPLYYAAKNGNTEITMLLLQKGAAVNGRSDSGQTALFAAAGEGKTGMVKLLIEKGADINARDGNYEQTPMHTAAENNRGDVVKLLLEKGADVNIRDKKQWTPLFYAVDSTSKTFEVAKLLIEKGAVVNARTRDQFTPLHFVTSKEVAELLLQNGADINARDSSYGLTPIHQAAENNRVDFVKLLLEKGADVNIRDNRQWTPLFYAASSYNKTFEVAKLLIENGADVTAVDREQNTPALTAEKRNHPEIAAMIRRQGGGSPRQDFEALAKKVANDAGDVGSEDLQTIVRLARMLVPPPAVPQEAQEEMLKGMTVFKLAKRPEDFSEAGEHFRKASRLAPWLPEPYFNRALSQEKLALARGQQINFTLAKYSLENYLVAATNPKDIQAGKQKMAELDFQMKRYDDFADESNLGLEAAKKGPGGHNEAIQHFRKAIEIYPDHPQADMVYFNLGDVYMRQGDLDSAYKYMQKAFELVPEPSEWPFRYTNMGVVLERRGDKAKACTYYKKGCAQNSRTSCDNYRKCP